MKEDVSRDFANVLSCQARPQRSLTHARHHLLERLLPSDVSSFERDASRIDALAVEFVVKDGYRQSCSLFVSGIR